MTAAPKIHTYAITERITAYALLDEFCRIALEEPNRIRFDSWLENKTLNPDRFALNVSSLTRIGERSRRTHAGEPPCGTVGCIAGWCSVLTGVPIGVVAEKVTGSSYSYEVAAWDDRHPIAKVLGLSTRQAQRLFGANDLYQSATEKTTGTRDHARAVVRHVRAFQAEHADQLKSTWVDPPSPETSPYVALNI